MKAEDLAFVADALLALCEKSPAAPFYTTATFDYKLRRGPRPTPFYCHLAGQGGNEEILRNECDEIFEAAKLTERQADVLARKLDGWTFDEIGDETGNTKQAAQRVFVQALKKLARAFHVYPYKGLSDIYRYELRRGHRSGGFGRL